MARSTCPKCDSTRFEVAVAEPKDSRFKVNFVQCASCGAVVGVMDYYNVPSLLDKIAAKLGFKLLD